MKKLALVGTALALALGLGATGCKKKVSSRGVNDPGMDDAAAASGCCGTAPGPGGALLSLGFVVLGLARTRRRPRRAREPRLDARERDAPWRRRG